MSSENKQYRIPESKKLRNFIEEMSKSMTRTVKYICNAMKSEYHATLDGKVALMCPECKRMTHIKTKVSIDIDCNTPDNYNYMDEYRIDADVVYGGICKYCGAYTAFTTIDEGISEAIELLNIKGYETKYCCEGHDTRGIYLDKEPGKGAYIMFEFDSDIAIIKKIISKYGLAEWYISDDNCIRSSINNNIERKESLEKLVRLLPYRNLSSDKKE